MHQSGQSIARSVNSSVKITNAAQWPQMLGSPGLGWVDLFTDQRSECPHSGHCHMDKLWEGIAVSAPRSELKAVTVPNKRSLYRNGTLCVSQFPKAPAICWAATIR